MKKNWNPNKIKVPVKGFLMIKFLGSLLFNHFWTVDAICLFPNTLFKEEELESREKNR
jgi:hypothetical protein